MCTGFGWINIFGAAIVILIVIPNIVGIIREPLLKKRRILWEIYQEKALLKGKNGIANGYTVLNQTY